MAATTTITTTNRRRARNILGLHRRKVASAVPYNELIVTTDDRNNALNRASAELSPHGAVAIASDIRRLDDASTLVEVLEWLVDAVRRIAADAQLFVVRGSALRAWRGAQTDQLSAGRRFPLNVGGRVVAVLTASS